MKGFLVFCLMTLCLVLGATSRPKFPSFIKACKRNTEALQCIIDNIDRCREHLAKGIPRLSIPPLAPMRIPSMDIEGNNMEIHLSDLSVHNLVAVEAIGGSMVLGYSLVLNLTIPYVYTEFTYEATGTLLGLKFRGEGSGYVNASDVAINMEAKSHPMERKGLTFLDIEGINVEYKSKDGKFHVDNLFRNNEDLNAATNVLINENFLAFEEEIAPDISKFISTLVTSIARNLFSKFTYDELFVNEEINTLELE